MSKPDRFAHTLRELITPEMFTFLQNQPTDFGVVSVTDIKLSPDGKYADVFISSEREIEKLPKTLSPFGKHIRHTISKNLSIYTAPIIRFRIKTGNQSSGKTVAEIIQELENQYDLSGN